VRGRFDIVAVTFRLKIEVSKIRRDTISHFNIAHGRPGAVRSAQEWKEGKFGVVRGRRLGGSGTV
jgi:hypothetical protein